MIVTWWDPARLLPPCRKLIQPLTFIDFVIFSVHLGLQDISFYESFHDFLKCEHKEGIRQAWLSTEAACTVYVQFPPPTDFGQLTGVHPCLVPCFVGEPGPVPLFNSSPKDLIPPDPGMEEQDTVSCRRASQGERESHLRSMDAAPGSKAWPIPAFLCDLSLLCLLLGASASKHCLLVQQLMRLGRSLTLSSQPGVSLWGAVCEWKCA